MIVSANKLLFFYILMSVLLIGVFVIMPIVEIFQFKGSDAKITKVEYGNFTGAGSAWHYHVKTNDFDSLVSTHELTIDFRKYKVGQNVKILISENNYLFIFDDEYKFYFPFFTFLFVIFILVALFLIWRFAIPVSDF